ncbi:hypothetical protein GJ744_004479 [Endocarpon pusillum]|uniref:Stress-associated endoplasmic reticulum protein n=1 Tax=Endocarpon pusillum TaxID=364733 RepID=A0A8H7ATM9_9EURO|nr:hypothetical protein GJ744_004479 [Endocarpon pusillum]
MAQTPTQRRANAKFAKSEEKRMGKAESAVKKNADRSKPPISRGWIVLLAFVVCGSLAFELLRLFPVAWEFVAGFVARVAAVFK